MEALVLTGIKSLELKEIAQPEIKPDEVKIHTAFAGICGTDHALYAGLPGSAPAVPPIVLGHENSGVVVEVGSEVTNVKVGDRVAVDPNIYCGQCKYCRTGRPELCEHLSAIGVTRDGGFEDYFTAPASVVYPIPDNVSLKAAALVEPISCAVHGIQLLKVSPYQKALVTVFTKLIWLVLWMKSWPWRRTSLVQSAHSTQWPVTRFLIVNMTLSLKRLVHQRHKKQRLKLLHVVVKC